MRGVRLVRSLAAAVRPAARAAVLPMRVRALHVSVPVLASEADFQRAKAAVEKLSSRPSNDVLLRLYSLYKQATEGPNKTPEPGMFNIVAKAKWKAWAELGSMSAEEARQQYIDTVKAAGGNLDGGGGAAPAAPAASAAKPAAATKATVVTVHGGVHVVRLNRPEKKNALNLEAYREVEAAMDACAADPAGRVLVLTGTGDFYSSGNDLSNFTANMPPEGPSKLAEDGRQLLEGFVGRFIDFPKLLVAAVNGPAVGLPVTLLGLVDFVYASHRATFETPFSRLGQSPEACSSLTFPEILGPTVANEVLLMGRKLTAAEAERHRLVAQVFEHSVFMEEVMKRATLLSTLPPESVRISKKLIRSHRREELHRVNKEECVVLKDRWLSPECMDAIISFMSRKADK